MAAYKACLLALLAFGLFGTAAVAQEAKDMDLEDTGFVMRPALTPQQLERVKLLPPHKFIARTNNGRRYFLYADRDLCKCVFVATRSRLVSRITTRHERVLTMVFAGCDESSSV